MRKMLLGVAAMAGLGAAVAGLASPAWAQGMANGPQGSRIGGYSSATPGNSAVPMGGATGGNFSGTNFGGASSGTSLTGPAANPGVPSGGFDTNSAISYSSGAGAANATGGMVSVPPPSDKAMSNYRNPKINQLRGQQAAEGTANAPNGARPGHEPGVGQSEPASNQASNINPGTTRGAIAPRLPAPHIGPDASPHDLLVAARLDLASHRNGAAQEALERAETRLLDRSVAPRAAGTPDNGPMVDRIAEARRALASGDTEGARGIINSLLSDRSGDQGSARGGM